MAGWADGPLGPRLTLWPGRALRACFALRPGGTDGTCCPGLALRSGGTGITLGTLPLATSEQQQEAEISN